MQSKKILNCIVNYPTMTVKYELNTEELSDGLLLSIKNAFNKKRVKITVEEVEMDETEYLLSNEGNKRALEESIRQLERGEGIRFTLEEFEAYSKKL